MVSKKEKRDDIQLLRAVAVVSVIVFHLDEAWLQGGFLGVDVFFVISGFLITGIIIGQLREGTFSLSTFYLRRMKRLFPALALVLWVTVLVGSACLPPIPFRGLAEHLPWAALQVSNFSFMAGVDYFGPENESNPVLHTWSLAVEEQFYITWAPLLMLAFWMFRRRNLEGVNFRPIPLLLAVIALGIVGEIMTRTWFGDQVAFFSPMSRAWQLGMGGFVAAIFPVVSGMKKGKRIRRISGSVGFVVVLISMFFLSKETSANPALRSIPCLGAVLILLFPCGFLQGRLRGLTYIGDISYSLYLWHWPVICLMPYLLGTREQPILHLSAVFSFVVLSVLGYHFVEKPLMTNRKWNRFLSLRSSSAITALCMVAGAGFALRTEGDAGWRFDGGVTTDAERAYRKPFSFREYAAKQPEVDPMRLAADTEVLLIGDSHAGHFIPLVQEWAKEHDLRFFPYWATGYVAIASDVKLARWDTEGNLIGAWGQENESARKLHETIIGSDSIKVVFIAQRTAAYTHAPIPTENLTPGKLGFFDERNPEVSPEEVYEKQIFDYASSVVASGKQVVLLGQVPPLLYDPKPGASIVDRLLNRDWREDHIYLPANLVTRGDLEHRVYSKTSKLDGVFYLPTREHVTKTYSEDGQFLYDDANHLSYKGAMFLKEPLFKILRPLRIP